MLAWFALESACYHESYFSARPARLAVLSNSTRCLTCTSKSFQATSFAETAPSRRWTSCIAPSYSAKAEPHPSGDLFRSINHFLTSLYTHFRKGVE